MQKLTNVFLCSFLVIATACGSGNSGKDNKQNDTASAKKDTMEKKDSEQMGSEKDTMEKAGLKVYPIQTKDFPEAELSLEKPEKMDLEPGKVQFKFGVKNYTLKQATADANKNQLAESDKGQHIHFIVNNGPYMAKYEPSFKAEMKKGYHTVLAFLSRSYHESVKNDKAYEVQQFKVGQPDTAAKADLSKPHIFYSRPKGTYKGKDFEKLLLDFYPVNAELGQDAHKVRATINSTEFTFTEWKPYVVEGLKPGKLTVKLELLDSNGELVESKFNTVTREVTLKKGEDEMAENEEDDKSENEMKDS